jgi:hypothetical protein
MIIQNTKVYYIKTMVFTFYVINCWVLNIFYFIRNKHVGPAAQSVQRLSYGLDGPEIESR